MTPRSCKPIDPPMLHRIIDRSPSAYHRVANDALPELSEPAYGGRWGLVLMFAVAAFLGFCFAVGSLS